MAAFRFFLEKTNAGTEIKIEGDINENADLDRIILSGKETRVTLDLSGVTFFNSYGIRQWLKWLKTLPSTISIVYANCSKAVVDQMNNVRGVLAIGGKIHSFQVPFFCEKCNHQTFRLFTENQEFQGAKISMPQVPCDKCRSQTQINVIESKYFKFLEY